MVAPVCSNVCKFLQQILLSIQAGSHGIDCQLFLVQKVYIIHKLLLLFWLKVVKLKFAYYAGITPTVFADKSYNYTQNFADIMGSVQ